MMDARHVVQVFAVAVFAASVLGSSPAPAVADTTLRNSVANAVNERDQVVGFSDTSSGHIHAFAWDHGVMTDIGTLDHGAADDSSSNAVALNDRGDVIGYSTVRSGFFHAF